MAADVEVRWHRPVAETGKTEWQTAWLDAADCEAFSAEEVEAAVMATQPVGDGWTTIDLDMASQKIIELLG